MKYFKADSSPYKEYVNQTVPMLENIVEYYRKSDGETKKKILSCIFSFIYVLDNILIFIYIQLIRSLCSASHGTRMGHIYMDFCGGCTMLVSKKIVLEKGKVATCEFTTPVQVLFNASKVSERFNIKKEVENDLLSCLAPLTVGSCNLFDKLKTLFA